MEGSNEVAENEEVGNMDFQRITDSIAGMICIYSIEIKENHSYGEIRFVAANEAYIESLRDTMDPSMKESFKFIPNLPYTNYIPKNLNFENGVYQCAVEKKSFHTYVPIGKPEAPIWFHSTYIPLESDVENIGYCGIVIDVSERPDASNMSGISGDLAATVLEMSIKIEKANNFQEAMDNVIKDLRNLSKAKRCCIYLMDKEKRSVSVLCEDIAPDAAVKIPMIDIIDDKFYDLVETWESLLAGSSSLCVRNDMEMQLVKERDPGWYGQLVSNHVQTMLLYPLRFGGELLGYIWATNFDAEKSERIKETMEVACFILGSEIANNLLLERLKVMSSTDLLTGVLNRNEMNREVDAYSNGEIGAGRSVGVVFADLNGLKYVNDRDGHPAGDKLLKDAAKALLDVFERETIFRAGGDEFTMILEGITEEELEAKVAKLKEVMNRYEKVSFAVGSHYCDSARDVRVALREADQKMYQDKEQFYLTHPEIMRARKMPE